MGIRFFMEEEEQYELLKKFEQAYDIMYHTSTVELVQTTPTELYQRKHWWFNSVTELNIYPTSCSHMYKAFLMMHKRDYLNNAELKGISYLPGGVWQGKYIIHGEFYIDNNNADMREPFKELRKMVREISAKQINGYYIGKEAYKNKDKYERFILIEEASPREYDLPVE